MYSVTEVPSGDSATLGKIRGMGPLGRGREAASSGRDLRYTEELNSIIRT